MLCKVFSMPSSEEMASMSDDDIKIFIDQIKVSLFSAENLDALVDKVEEVNVKGEINLKRDVRDVIDNLISDRVQGLSKLEQVQAIRSELIEKLKDKVLERKISDSWRLIFPENEVEEDVAMFFGELDEGIQKHGIEGFGSLFMSLLVASPVVSGFADRLLSNPDVENYMIFDEISESAKQLAEQLMHQTTIENYKDVMGDVLLYVGSIYFIVKTINGLSDNIAFRTQASRNIEVIMRKYTHIKNYEVMLRTLDNLENMQGHRRLTIKRKMLHSLHKARSKYSHRLKQSKMVYGAIKHFTNHKRSDDQKLLLENEIANLELKINKKKQDDLIKIITLFINKDISEIYFMDSIDNLEEKSQGKIKKIAERFRKDFAVQKESYQKLIKKLLQRKYKWLELSSVVDNSSVEDISVIEKKVRRRISHTQGNVKEIDLRVGITKKSKNTDQRYNELHRLQYLLENIITRLTG